MYTISKIGKNSIEVIIMYLSSHNQLTLLHDLLYEQLTYSSETCYEYKKMKKLIQSLIAQRNVDQELLNILPEIYYYCLKGEHAYSYTSHIKEHQHKIKRWLRLINQSKIYQSS